MKDGTVRASALSVVSPRGSNPVAWAVETRGQVRSTPQRRDETLNIIQSFSPSELDAVNVIDVEKAHTAGVTLASKIAPG
ncbi:relaxase/mobilization nuclease domain-containing protein [Corynebacterium sp. ES2715-CONJ3]|uniref:relaxase/mobilization nuclease domain-containing protein n=1 Tax=Corynebacterium sp. ES2715-CONJ3 TaxID=2974028 RepID=UPI00216830A0|nr:relaxase/mobilization nuclease domain-containing protein [Corynebacterium sp. ES2715-CONJ3]MCS4491547.1 relaxase/mobilization nuclease domain-containing protein [Corynebacterium sp. ES2715-CONJ3]